MKRLFNEGCLGDLTSTFQPTQKFGSLRNFDSLSSPPTTSKSLFPILPYVFPHLGEKALWPPVEYQPFECFYISPSFVASLHGSFTSYQKTQISQLKKKSFDCIGHVPAVILRGREPMPCSFCRSLSPFLFRERERESV